MAPVHPDALSGAIAYLRNEWGHEGYWIVEVAARGCVAIITVRHFDGSEFRIACDQYGVPRCPTCGEAFAWNRDSTGAHLSRGWWQPPHVADLPTA